MSKRTEIRLIYIELVAALVAAFFFNKVARYGNRIANGHSKQLDMAYRCMVMLVIPVLPALVVSIIWFFRRGIHVPDGIDVAMTAWNTIVGVLYALAVGVVFAWVYTKYASYRDAFVRYDAEAYICLRNQEVSPLIHTIIGVLSCFVITGFMVAKYPDVKTGMLMVGSIAYLMALLFFVVMEIDDPCNTGVWRIKNRPPEWERLDIKEVMKKRHDMAREEFLKQHPECGPDDPQRLH